MARPCGGHCGFTKTAFVRLVIPHKTALLRQNVARLQVIGIALAELTLQGKATTVEVAALRAERFAQARTLRAQVESLNRPYDPLLTTAGLQLQADTSFDH